jgi:hypothetical protein
LVVPLHEAKRCASVGVKGGPLLRQRRVVAARMAEGEGMHPRPVARTCLRHRRRHGVVYRLCSGGRCCEPGGQRACRQGLPPLRRQRPKETPEAHTDPKERPGHACCCAPCSAPFAPCGCSTLPGPNSPAIHLPLRWRGALREAWRTATGSVAFFEGAFDF